MRATPTVLSRAPIIKSKSLSGLLMASETLPISESGYCLRFLTLISPLTGRTSKQLVSKSRHELLNKIYSIFSSVLLDEEPVNRKRRRPFKMVSGVFILPMSA